MVFGIGGGERERERIEADEGLPQCWLPLPIHSILVGGTDAVTAARRTPSIIEETPKERNVNEDERTQWKRDRSHSLGRTEAIMTGKSIFLVS